MEEHLARSIGMELHHRVELIETLLEEAEQKMSALQHALGAQTRAKAEIEQAGHDTSFSQEGQTLKYEQALWERVHTGLTEVRTMLEDLEESERQRGLSQ
jgi:Skp family chaperone for outer membrane proteins